MLKFRTEFGDTLMNVVWILLGVFALYFCWDSTPFGMQEKITRLEAELRQIRK